MSLKSIASTQTKEIFAEGGSVVIHQLTVKDIADLFSTDPDNTTSLFNSDGDGTELFTLVEKAPDFVAALICKSAREPDAIEHVKENFGFALQLNLLVEILTLSTPDKDVMANFMAGVQVLTEALSATNK